MVHTIRVYAYGTTVRVWLFVPYAYSYYTIIVYKQYIAIANTVLLFTLNHELYPLCIFLLYIDVFALEGLALLDKLVISSGQFIFNPLLCMKVTLN